MSFRKFPYGYKVFEILIIRANLEFLDAPKLSILLLEVAYDSEYFLIVDLVVILGRRVLLREEYV